MTCPDEIFGKGTPELRGWSFRQAQRRSLNPDHSSTPPNGRPGDADTKPEPEPAGSTNAPASQHPPSSPYEVRLPY
jgi:hypothetical protein